MNDYAEQSPAGVSYDMSSQSVGGFGYDPHVHGVPSQAFGQPGLGWLAAPASPQVQQYSSGPKPQHRVAVAIISLLVLVPISLGLLLSVQGGSFTYYPELVARLIALGIVCGTIAAINHSFHHSRH